MCLLATCISIFPVCPGTKAPCSPLITKNGPPFSDTRCSRLPEHLALEGANIKWSQGGKVRRCLNTAVTEASLPRGPSRYRKLVQSLSDRNAQRNSVEQSVWNEKTGIHIVGQWILWFFLPSAPCNPKSLLPLNLQSTDVEVKTLTCLGHLTAPGG